MAILITVSLFAGCGVKGQITQTAGNPTQTLAQTTEVPVMGDDITPTDYSVKGNWISLPDTDFDVDVFDLYPTSWTRGENEPYYCEIDNESLRKTAPFNRRRQAAAFEYYGETDTGVIVSWNTEAPGTEYNPLLSEGAIFPKGVYHLNDYGFYFNNIRENAAKRIEAYQNKK